MGSKRKRRLHVVYPDRAGADIGKYTHYVAVYESRASGRMSRIPASDVYRNRGEAVHPYMPCSPYLDRVSLPASLVPPLHRLWRRTTRTDRLDHRALPLPRALARPRDSPLLETIAEAHRPDLAKPCGSGRDGKLLRRLPARAGARGGVRLHARRTARGRRRTGRGPSDRVELRLLPERQRSDPARSALPGRRRGGEPRPPAVRPRPRGCRCRGASDRHVHP